MSIFKYAFYFLGIIMITSCNSENKLNQVNKIQIEWELAANYGPGQKGSLAYFSFHNGGKYSLHSSNWVLFFNMAPRRIFPAEDTTIADVVHINGDWYKLVPRNDFSLEPGETIRIWYNFEGCVLKETDAPLGLYFVLYNENAEESRIVAANNYMITPLERENQVKCRPDDEELHSSPHKLFEKYEKLNAPETDKVIPIIPAPAGINMQKETVLLDDSWHLFFSPGLESEAAILQQKLESMAGLEMAAPTENDSLHPAIQLILTPFPFGGNNSESYRMRIEDGLIRLEGSEAGVFYGIQSLLQMIPYETMVDKSGNLKLKKMLIEDAPRFKYRGQHIDVCRNFQTKKQLLKIIDLMSYYKLNRLLLYLTEDEAWRLQIRGLPELTEIGSNRGHPQHKADCLPPAYGSGPFTVADNNFGTGYYSREDFKEIIQYAHERHIQLIPAINFPGHARAAIKAMEVRYERYMTEGKEEEANEFRLIDPEDQSVYRSAQYYNDNVVCVARESLYHFYETVLDDVLSIYDEAKVPIDMVYTGGDEVPEGVWARSPLCDSLLTTQPDISDPKNLQNYFFDRLLQILDERDLKAGGWEEVALKKNKKGQYRVNQEFTDRRVVPYIWSNLGGSEDLGYRIANTGYDIVLCPVTNFYFDLAYNDDPREPGLYWGGFIEERDAWEFAPYNMLTDLKTGKEFSGSFETLQPAARKRILGLQAQLWHETVKGGAMMEYYLLPKMIAFAERCWAPAPVWESMSDREERVSKLNAEWKSFSNTLYEKELPRLNHLNGGYNYRVPPAGIMEKDGSLHANAVSPKLTIRYTLDGSEPDENSEEYTSPLKAGQRIIFRVFDAAGHSSLSINTK